VRLVRRVPTLMLLVTATVFVGAASEGFDRLSEAHLLRDVGVPSFVGFDPALVVRRPRVGGTLLALLAANLLVPRVTTVDAARWRARCSCLSASQICAGLAFALTGSSRSQSSRSGAELARTLVSPVYATWLNRTSTTRRARDGELDREPGRRDRRDGGGPIVGVIGKVVSLPAALVTSALFYVPLLGLTAARRAQSSRSRQRARPSRQCGSSARPSRCGAPSTPARRRAAELRARDPPHARVDCRLREDRLGELGPRAVAAAASARRRTDARAARSSPREMADVRRRRALVVDDRDLVPLAPRRSIVVTKFVRARRRARRARRSTRAPGRALAVQLRAAVRGQRARRIGLDVRLALRAVEDVIGRVVDERRAELRCMTRAADVHGAAAS
jgi:hypothetical protein